jgi:hypothetical protein
VYAVEEHSAGVELYRRLEIGQATQQEWPAAHTLGITTMVHAGPVASVA